MTQLGFGEAKQFTKGTSLEVQWLRLCASIAGGTVSIPGWGTEIPHAVWCGPKKQNLLKVTQQASTWLARAVPLPGISPTRAGF